MHQQHGLLTLKIPELFQDDLQEDFPLYVFLICFQLLAGLLDFSFNFLNGLDEFLRYKLL